MRHQETFDRTGGVKRVRMIVGLKKVEWAIAALSGKWAGDRMIVSRPKRAASISARAYNSHDVAEVEYRPFHPPTPLLWRRE